MRQRERRTQINLGFFLNRYVAGWELDTFNNETVHKRQECDNEWPRGDNSFFKAALQRGGGDLFTTVARDPEIG